jgi:hypothetical protein
MVEGSSPKELKYDRQSRNRIVASVVPVERGKEQDMRRVMIGATLALLLAACDGGRREAGNAAANAAAANAVADTANQIAALPEGQRNAVFIRAIRDTGDDCQFVEGSEPAGDYRGYPVWRARCEGGATFTIVITADGTAQVINDAEARLAGFNETGPSGNGQGAAEQNAQDQ